MTVHTASCGLDEVYTAPQQFVVIATSLRLFRAKSGLPASFLQTAAHPRTLAHLSLRERAVCALQQHLLSPRAWMRSEAY